MSTKLALSLILLVASSTVVAQDGWQRFGAALGGGRASADEAYRRGMADGLEIKLAREQLRTAQLGRQFDDLQNRMRTQLAQYWVQLGLEEAEAHSLTASFELRQEQTGFNQRAKREGAVAGIQAAMAAYQRYDYLLANQLLFAATREGVPSDFPPAP